MLSNFDEMKARKGIKKFNIDAEYNIPKYISHYGSVLFDIIRECNDTDMYGVAKILGRYLFIEPNKYSNDTHGINEMTEELIETLKHMIKTDQAEAYFNKDAEKNNKLVALMKRFGMTPVDMNNTDFVQSIKNLTELSEWELNTCGITSDDMKYYNKDNPVKDFESEFSPLSQFTTQMFFRASTDYDRYGDEQNYYAEVGGIPILATHNGNPLYARNTALNNETIKLLRDVELQINGPKR